MIDIREHGGSFVGSKNSEEVTSNENLSSLDFGSYPIIENISKTNLKKGDLVGFYLHLEKVPLPPDGIGGFSFDGKYCVSHKGDFYKFDNGVYKKLPRYLTSPYTPTHRVYNASFSKDCRYAVITFSDRGRNYDREERFVFQRNDSDDSFKEIFSDKGFNYGSFVNSEKYKYLYFDNGCFLTMNGSTVSKKTIDPQNIHSTSDFTFANVSGHNLAQEVMSDEKDVYSFHKIDRDGGKSTDKVTIDLKNKTIKSDTNNSATIGGSILGNAYRYLSVGYVIDFNQKWDPYSFTMQDFFKSSMLNNLGNFIGGNATLFSEGYNTRDFQSGRTDSQGLTFKQVKNKKIPFVYYNSSGNDDTFSYWGLLFGNNLLNLQVSRILEEGKLHYNSRIPREDGTTMKSNYYGIEPTEGYAHVMKVRPIKDYLDPLNYGALPQVIIELKVNVPVGKKVYH